MDSLTQAVFGAGIQGAMLGRFHGRKAVLAGAALATLPDLDVLIDHGDPISIMINHRGFSHSLFVLTAFAFLLTWLWRRWRPTPEYGAGRLFLTLWLVLITHPMLDAFTSYGTQLWWPFKPTPSSWSSIFIIDPFFTVPLALVTLAAFIIGPGAKIRRAFVGALAWCGIYLAASLIIKQQIENRVYELAEAEGIQVVDMFSTPAPFNILLWRVAARTVDDHYVEVITSIFDDMPPEHIRLPLNSALGRDFLTSPTGMQTQQLAGLQWFTGGWLRYDDIHGHLVVSDLRMGLGTGHYSFRFLVGRRATATEPWQAVRPTYWPSERGMEWLPVVARRVWSQDVPLPLAAWEPLMHRFPSR